MTATDTEANDDALDTELMGAVERLVRGGWDELESSVVTVGQPVTLDGTRTTVRLHFLRSDPNGKARLETLARQLADQLVHYCIPRRRLLEAQALPPDRQAPAISRMTRQASQLFTQTQERTGEGSELLLYTLLEKHLGIPQVLSKMSLKTNTEVHIHGADGVHAKLLSNGNLALYWGESKMYDSVAGAMTDALDSLKPFLTGEAQDQDLFLIRHYADLGDPELTASLLEYFDDGSVKSAKVEMRGACLIGFSHDAYPLLPAQLEDVQQALNELAANWGSSVRTRVQNRQLTNFELEIFLVPVPSVDDFRFAIRNALGLGAA
jgi:hypothetical protein